jgi:serine/threonine protein kinase
MLRERNDHVLDKYEIVKRLGEGSMGSVSLVRVKDSARGGSAFKHKKKGLFGNVKTSRKGSISEKRAVQVDYALKTIIISRVSPEFVDELKNEIALLKQMDHPNIVKAYEVFYQRHNLSIIMKLCSGGDLYTRVPYSEKDAARFTRQILSAINYMVSICFVLLMFYFFCHYCSRDDAPLLVILARQEHCAPGP